MHVTKQSEKLSSYNSDELFKHYEQMMAIAGNILYITDSVGHCTYISPSVQQILGYAPEEIIHQHYSRLIHPDWKQHITDHYDRQISQLTPQTVVEFPMLTRSGNMRWVEQ